MVIYWSIASAADLVQYGMGKKDTFKGTGVWSFIKFSRNPVAADDESDAIEEIESGKNRYKESISSSKVDSTKINRK